MQYGLIPLNIGFDNAARIVDVARDFESIGGHAVWTAEHVMIPTHYDSAYPYNDSGDMGMPPETPFFDPLITLSSIAQASPNLRLCTGINILPQSNPLLLAKQAASLDQFSNGRLSLGLGLGWLREEYEAMGVPWRRRGARFDDYLYAIRQVWSGDVVEHKSEFLNWQRFKSYPLPRQPDGPPVIIGGTNQKAIERVARSGDGWYVLSENVEGMARLIDRLRIACDQIQRDMDEVEIVAMWDWQQYPEDRGRFSEMGVRHLTVRYAPGSDYEEWLENLALAMQD